MQQMLTERSRQQTLERATFRHRSYVPSNDERHWYNEVIAFTPLHVTNDHVNLNQRPITNTFTSATQTADNVSNKMFIFIVHVY